MNTARKPVARQGSDPLFETRHMRQITVLSLIVMLLLGALISVGLGALTAHFANDVVHKTLYAVLKTACGIAEPLLQFFAFGILGYSVMRWGFSKSSRIFLLALCCVFVQQLGSFVSLCVYYTPKIAFESILPSQSLVLLLNLCIVLLEVGVQAAFCAIYRAKHTDKAVMPVGITKKNAFSRKNPLSRVYFVMNLLAVLFSLIPAVLQAISDYRELGFFRNFSEFFYIYHAVFMDCAVLLLRLCLFVPGRLYGNALYDGAAQAANRIGRSPRRKTDAGSGKRKVSAVYGAESGTALPGAGGRYFRLPCNL